MAKITKARLKTVRGILTDSDLYDAASTMITSNGDVFARIDRDKTKHLDAELTVSYRDLVFVNHIDHMVTPSGDRTNSYERKGTNGN